MINSMLAFTDNESHTQVRYVIGRYLEPKWYHFLDFSDLEDAKKHLQIVREKHPDIEFRLFKKTESVKVTELSLS